MMLTRMLLSGAVVPFAGTWIEIIRTAGARSFHVSSFPSRERGLKYQGERVMTAQEKSFPSRERGLKYGDPEIRRITIIVVPFAGTWIEIVQLMKRRQKSSRRSLRGNVD